MMDANQNAEALSAEEQAYFKSGGTTPMPGWENYSDISLEEGEEVSGEEGEAFSVHDEGEETDDSLPEDDMPEKNERPCSSDPQGEAVIGALDADIDAFSEETPAYAAALLYLARRRDTELAAFGFADERMQDSRFRARQMESELKQVVASALAGRHNPAAVIYNIACGYGFQADDSSDGSMMGGNVTLQKLASMSEQDFGKWYENNKKTFRRLMGG